jgi:tetratricopeptide (TPR) repeat protein
MRPFINGIVVFTLCTIQLSRADNILVKKKDSEPTVYASEVLVYRTNKDRQGNISSIDYVSWNAKDLSIEYNTVRNVGSDNEIYSARESVPQKKQDIVQRLSEKGISAEIHHDLTKFTLLNCLMLDYSLPGYIYLGKGVPDDTYISLIESSGTVHLFPFKVVESLVHSGEGNIVVRLKGSKEYKGIWEKRTYGSIGHSWTFKLQGLTEEGEFRAFSLSDISSIKFTQVKVSSPPSDEPTALSEQIKQMVIGLEYPDEVADDFVKMLMSWKDAQGQPVLMVWKQRLDQARQDYEQGKTSDARLAKVEETIVKELSHRIRKEVGPNMDFWDLADVIKHKETRCVGYSHLLCVLGNPLGLSVTFITVQEPMTGVLLTKRGHTANMVTLADHTSLMVDLTPDGFVSPPFMIEKEFAQIRNHLELRDKENPLKIHRMIRILDRKGLLAQVYAERGSDYSKQGKYALALSSFNDSLALDPDNAGAYDRRGATYGLLGQHNKAISDFNQAIQLNPKCIQAYDNRGIAYGKLGQYNNAISDFNKAIQLNPRFAQAYYDRGVTCKDAGQLIQAVSDFTKTLELDPEHGDAYCERGISHAKLNQRPEAISDFTRGIELNPRDAKLYMNRGVVYAYLKRLDDARRDLLKAVELDPSLKTHAQKISELFKLDLRLE